MGTSELQVGDRVKLRNEVEPDQRYGEVVGVDGVLVHVLWDGNERSSEVSANPDTAATTSTSA